ncbi:unnamed protein product [Ilex paraguariensis]|uniref:Uncharacterized protein n=1 Tax=Ilex paraguariensis TaxID=185542 RepID=A0ABC8UQE8_9AQUA
MGRNKIWWRFSYQPPSRHPRTANTTPPRAWSSSSSSFDQQESRNKPWSTCSSKALKGVK